MRITAVALFLCASFAWAQTMDQKSADQKKRTVVAESLPASSENKGAWDLGVWGGGGHSVTGGISNTSVANAGFRIGKILTAQHGSGWYRGNLEYAVDLIPIYVVSVGDRTFDPCRGIPACFAPVFLIPGTTAYGGGFNPFIVKWNFIGTKRFSPYLEFGGGLLFTNKDVPSGTSNINFTPQASFGMNIFTREKRAVSLDFRYVHISNAGLAKPNPGINTIQGLIGYHWFK